MAQHSAAKYGSCHLDEVPALSVEREALWKRIGEASFLTGDEKRAAAGYDPLPVSFAPSSVAALRAKFNPDQPRVPAGNSDGGQWAGTGDGNTSSDLEQSLTTAPDQAPREDLAHLQAIANSPIIFREVNTAWESSRPDDDEPQEQGFWISRNEVTGEVFIRPFANPGTKARITPGAPPDDVIAFFHTHPLKPEFRGIPAPSRSDLDFAAYTSLPGLLQSHNGMYYFGPPLRLRFR